jgi:D-alanyl-D-alanine carboxypeptidase
VVAQQVPNGQEITLRQLANHTSGVCDYGDPIIGGGVGVRPLLTKSYHPEELVAWAIENCQPDFAPGEEGQWKYSNTGYVLLGMALEAATGQSYETLLQERIFQPLGMRDTYLLTGVPEPGSIANGYLAYPFDVNTTDWNGTQGWAAGAIVSTATDLAKFANAFMKGQLFQDPATLQVMQNWVGTTSAGGLGYGIGLIEMLPGVWGHRGQTAGFTSIIAMDPEEDFIFIALTNAAEGGVSSEQGFIGRFLNLEPSP